jgi:simple sugar transport system ATP-binding protein
MVLSTYYRDPFARGIVVNEESIEANAQRLVREFDVRTPGTMTMAATLSAEISRRLWWPGSSPGRSSC